MTYFKIIKNDNVVSVGCVFLKWNPNKKRMYVCSVNDGQFVQTYDEKQIYKDSWLKPSPDDVKGYETAKIIIINQTEYDDIKEMLEEGESVVIENEPEQPHEIHLEEKNETEEKPMTISEMRRIILEQQKQIDELMHKLS